MNETKSTAPLESDPASASGQPPLLFPVPDPSCTDMGAGQSPVQAEPPSSAAASPDQQPVPAPDGTVQPPDEARPCDEPCQADSPPRLDFWNGEKLAGRVIGVVLQPDCQVDAAGPKLRMVAVSDDVTTYLVRPAELKEFLIQHADRMMLYHDAPLADIVLWRIFVKGDDLPTEMLQTLKFQGSEILAWLAVLHMLNQQNDPPPGELCRILIGYVLSHLSPEDPAVVHIRGLLKACRGDGRECLAASAMAIVVTFRIGVRGIQDKRAVSKRIEAITAKVFAYSRRAIQTILDKRGAS